SLDIVTYPFSDRPYLSVPIFFYNHTPTTEIYTLSLHDALPISTQRKRGGLSDRPAPAPGVRQLCLLDEVDDVEHGQVQHHQPHRSEEHTSELQSLAYLVCRLLLEKKKAYRPRVGSQLVVDRSPA